MNKYNLSATVGVLERLTEEELFPYQSFEVEYSSVEEYNAMNPSDLSFLANVLKIEFQKHLLETGKLRTMLDADGWIDLLSFGFKKL